MKIIIKIKLYIEKLGGKVRNFFSKCRLSIVSTYIRFVKNVVCVFDRKFFISFILFSSLVLFFILFYQAEVSFYLFPEVFLEDLNTLIEDGALILRNANYIDPQGYFFYNEDYSRVAGITGGSLFLIKYRRFIQRLQLLRRARTVYPKDPDTVTSSLFHEVKYASSFSDHSRFERHVNNYPVLPLVKNYLFLPVTSTSVGRKLIIGKASSVGKKGNKNRYRPQSMSTFFPYRMTFDLFFTFNPGEFRDRPKDYGYGFYDFSFNDITGSFLSVLNNLVTLNNRRRRFFYERLGQKDQTRYVMYYYYNPIIMDSKYPRIKHIKQNFFLRLLFGPIRYKTSGPFTRRGDMIYFLRFENLFTNLNQDVNPFVQREKLLQQAKNRFLANRMDPILFRLFVSNYDIEMIKYWHFDRKYTERILFPSFPEQDKILMKPRTTLMKKFVARDYPFRYRWFLNGLRQYTFSNFKLPHYILRKARRQFLFAADVKQPFKWIESKKIYWFFEGPRWWTRAGDYYRLVWLDNPTVWPSAERISRLNGSYFNKKTLQKDIFMDLKNDKLNFPAILRYHVQADIEDEAYMQRKTNEAVKKSLMNDMDLVNKFIFVYVNLPLDSFIPPKRYDRMIPERFAYRYLYIDNPINRFIFKTGKWNRLLFFTKRFYLHKNEFEMPMRRNFDLNAGRNAIAQLEISKGTYNRISPVADNEYMIRKQAVGWLPKLSDNLQGHMDFITREALAPCDIWMVNFAMLRGYRPQKFADFYDFRAKYYNPFVLMERFPKRVPDIYYAITRTHIFAHMFDGVYYLNFLRSLFPYDYRQGLTLARYYHAYYLARPSKRVGSKLGPYSPIHEKYKPADYSYPLIGSFYDDYRDEMLDSDHAIYNNKAERVLITNEKYWESFDNKFVKSFPIIVPVVATNNKPYLKTMDGLNDAISSDTNGHFIQKHIKFSDFYFQTFKKTANYRKEFRKNIYLDLSHKYSLAMYDYLTLVKRIAPYRFYKDKEDDLEPNFYLFDRDSRFDPDIELHNTQAPEAFEWFNFARPRVRHPIFVKSRKKWVDYYLKKKSIIKGYAIDNKLAIEKAVKELLKKEAIARQNEKKYIEAEKARMRAYNRGQMNPLLHYNENAFTYLDYKLEKGIVFNKQLGSIRRAFLVAGKKPPTLKEMTEFVLNKSTATLIKSGEYRQELPDSMYGITLPVSSVREDIGYPASIAARLHDSHLDSRSHFPTLYNNIYKWLRKRARNYKDYNRSLLETETYRFLTNYYRIDYLYQSHRRPYALAWGIRPFRGAVGFSDKNKGSDFLWNDFDTFDDEGFMGGGHDMFNYEVLINKNRSDMSNIKSQGFYNLYTHHDDRHTELSVHDDYNNVLMDQSNLPSYYNETLYYSDEDGNEYADTMFNQGKRSVEYINMMYNSNEDDPSRSTFWETFFTRYKYKPKNFYFPYAKIGEFRKYFLNLDPSVGGFIFIHRFDVLNNILFNFYRIYQFFGTNQNLQTMFKSFKVNFDFLSNNFFPLSMLVYPLLFVFEMVGSGVKLFFLSLIKYIIIFFKFWLLLLAKVTNLIFGVYLFEGVRLGGLYLFLAKMNTTMIDRLSMFHERFTFIQLEQLFQYIAYLKTNLFVYVDSEIFEQLSGVFVDFLFYSNWKLAWTIFIVTSLFVFFVTHVDEVFRGANIEALDKDNDFYTIFYMIIAANCCLCLYWGYYNY